MAGRITYTAMTIVTEAWFPSDPRSLLARAHSNPSSNQAAHKAPSRHATCCRQQVARLDRMSNLSTQQVACLSNKKSHLATSCAMLNMFNFEQLVAQTIGLQLAQTGNKLHVWTGLNF